MPAHTVPVKAGGDINPSRFVTVSGANHTVVESNSGDVAVLGIADEGMQDAPIPQNTDVLAASSGEHFQMHPYGSECLLEVGTGGLTLGTYAKPDADGKGVTASSGDTAFALVIETASAGEKARVICISAHNLV